MANEKLTQFATAVGTDIKEIKQSLTGKAEVTDLQEIKTQLADKAADTELRTYVDDQIKQAKEELVGGAPEELDTLKEIVDKIEAAGGSTDNGIVSKMAELGQRVDELEQADPLTAYNQAKA